MQALRIALVVMLSVVLSAAYGIASEKGSGYEAEGAQMKGSHGMHAETNDITVSGDISFANYYSMGGEKCAAFMETEDGMTLCIIDNMAASKLKKEIGGKGKVKIMGSMKMDADGKYVAIEEYNVIEKAPEKKGSGRESKGSGNKGSY